MKSMKKAISILLALVMCLSLLPMSAFADTAEDGYVYATQADLDTAFSTALDALEAGVETGDVLTAVSAMDEYIRVYWQLSSEDQAARAGEYQYVLEYRESLAGGNPDAGIQPLALLVSERFKIQVNIGYLDGGTFHMVESKWVESNCQDGTGHAGFNHTMSPSAILSAAGYPNAGYKVTKGSTYESDSVSTTRVTYNIQGGAPYKADQIFWITDGSLKPTVEQPDPPGSSNPPGTSSGSGSYFLQAIYVNKDKTEYTYGPKIASSTTTRRWYYLNQPSVPSGYTLKGWQSSHYHGTGNYLKEWWPVSDATYGLIGTNQYNTTVILNSGEGVYLIYQTTKDPEPDTNTIALTYDAKGGSINGEPTYIDSRVTTDTTQTFQNIIPVRDDYDFLGWTAANGAYVQWPLELSASMTVYAQWKAVSTNPATVRYLDGENGTVKRTDNPNGNAEYTVLSPGTVGLTAPDGKVFSHWALVDSTGMYFGGDKITPAAGSTWTFYPVWKDDDSQTGSAQYTVQWIKAADNTVIKTEQRNGTEGYPVSINEPDKTLTGYIYDAGNVNKVEQAILAATGTVLKLYFTVDPNFVDDGQGIGITKTPDQTTAKVGDTVSWKITVTNKSNMPKTVTLNDQLTGASLSQPSVSLAKAGETGASATVTATYKVVEADAGKNLTNVVVGTTKNATTGADETDTGTSAPIAVDELKPNIVVTKTVSSDTPKPGDPVTYTITVKNTGDAKAENVVVTDVLDNSLTFTGYTGDATQSGNDYTFGELSVGQSKQVKITATVNSDAAVGTKIPNSAVAGWTGKPADGKNPDGTEPKGEVTITVGEKLYTVTFCANGGAWKGDEVDPNADLTQLHRSVPVKPGETVQPMENPELANFKPDTWYTADGAKFDFSTPITSDIELFAHWTADRTYPQTLTVSKDHTSATGQANTGDLLMYQIAVANGTESAWDRLLIRDVMPVGLEMHGTYAVMIIDENNNNITSSLGGDLQFDKADATDSTGEVLTWWLETENLPQGATVILGYCAEVTAEGGTLTNTVTATKFGTSASSVAVATGDDSMLAFEAARFYTAAFAAAGGPPPIDPNAPSSSDSAEIIVVPGGDQGGGDQGGGDQGGGDQGGGDQGGGDQGGGDQGGGGGDDTYIPDDPTPLNPTPNNPPEVEIDDPATPLASANGLNSVDHFAYVIGYDDGTVRPENKITRAEVATIFFRLMTDVYRAANWSTTNDFSDVAAGSWYNNAISTCAKAGLVNGYSDGTFKPDQSITRAEFATIAARFLDEEITGAGAEGFADIEGHWAETNILRAAEAGWVNGDNGRFRPDDYISRAEVMTIVNRMLNRVPDADHMLPEMKTWSDNPKTAWYYEAVQEATNEHAYEWIDENVENWTELLTVRDWAALEKEWATEYSAED